MDGTVKVASVTGIDVDLKVAGPGARSYAFLIDLHIRALVAVLWLFVVGYLYLTTADSVPTLNPQQNVELAFTVVLPAAALYLLYHPVLEVLMRGRTPGKRMAGVRIARRDGGVPGVGALLVRNVFRIIDSLPGIYAIGLVTTLVTRESVRIGDIAAGTLLVFDDIGGLRKPGFASLTPQAVDQIGLARTEVVRDLLQRWPGLQRSTRRELATRLLRAAGQEVYDLDDDGLRRALEAMLR